MKLALIMPVLFTAMPAAAQPASYRAVGTEPFWSLSIDRASITFRPADGRPVTVAKPRPIVGINGELYRTRTITVDITHVRCSDGMSDRVYPDTVRVTIGPRTLKGCGGENPVADTLLTETSWRITAIGGRPVRIDRPAILRFTGERVEGRICNSFSGNYRFAGGVLTTDRVVATRMACGGGASETENIVLYALGQRLKVHSGNADTLVLSDGRTGLTLRRVR